MNLNQVKRNNLKSYNSFVYLLAAQILTNLLLFRAIDYVDPNASLDCTGMWENFYV